MAEQDDSLIDQMISGFQEEGDLPNAYRDAAEGLGTASDRAGAGWNAAASGAAGDLTATYADIEALGRQLSGHGAFVRERQEAMNRVVSDPDFVESIVLSPATAGAVGAAVLSANAVLIVSVVAADAMAIVTATVVSTLQLADSALSVSAAGLGGVADMGWALTTGVGNITVAQATTTLAVAGTLTLGSYLVASGLEGALVSAVSETVRALGEGATETWDEMLDDQHPWAAASPLGLLVPLVGNVAGSWSSDRFWGGTVGDLEGSLGALGPGYDAVLQGLILAGGTLGMFDDGDPFVGINHVGADELDARRDQAARDAWDALAGPSSDVSFEEFRSQYYDAEGQARPRDVKGLFLGAAQIDFMGQQDQGVVRIIETTGPDGITRYTVQIPSTQEWNPYSSSGTPNDLTSDVHAMAAGDQTALARATYEAMSRAGIGPQDPVMLVGFSLGGITAGAMAAGDSGYNIQQVVTGGAPVARFDIPENVRVSAFESPQDPVAILDGRPAQEGHNRVLVREDAPTLSGEEGGASPGTAHNAWRYSVMAGASEVNDDPEITQFLGGESEDYFVTRR